MQTGSLYHSLGPAMEKSLVTCTMKFDANIEISDEERIPCLHGT